MFLKRGALLFFDLGKTSYQYVICKIGRPFTCGVPERGVLQRRFVMHDGTGLGMAARHTLLVVGVSFRALFVSTVPRQCKNTYLYTSYGLPYTWPLSSCTNLKWSESTWRFYAAKTPTEHAWPSYVCQGLLNVVVAETAVHGRLRICGLLSTSGMPT